MFHRCITAIFLLIALTARPQRQDIRFGHYGTDKGLSHSNVICILQDHSGFMWFGTAAGLNQYDGYNFTVYRNNPADPNSLSQDYINALAEDKNHVIWIATSGGGLNSFSCDTKKITNYKHNPADTNSIAGDYLGDLLVDHQGYVWIATNNGLDKFDPLHKTFKHYRHQAGVANSLADNDLNSLYEDAQHNLWVGTINAGLDFF